MSNVTIGRYDSASQASPEGVEELAWSGWIEGQDSDGKSWIMYLDGSTGRH